MLGGPTLLDGAMGTALIARGLPPETPPEVWTRDRPEEVARVHGAHAGAGAQVLLTCTFGCASPRAEQAVGAEAIPALCAQAVRLARRSAPARVLVAGSVGPTGLAGPDAARAMLEARYAVPFRALTGAGADLLWIESQWDLDEARAALAAARAVGRATVVTFTFAERGGRLGAPDGRSAEACLSAIASEGALAAGVNCVFPGPALTALAAWAAAHLSVPFVAKPSPGLPGAVAAPEAFADALRPAFAAGLRIAGGCCGATADHLRAIAPLVSAA